MSQPTRKTCNLVDERDGCCCVRCGKSLYSALTFSRHHRLMRSHAFPGLHGTSNLILLCGSGTTGCHGWVHAHPSESYRNGWLVRSTNYPDEMPVMDHRHGWVLLDDEGHWTPADETTTIKENQ
jgi:hypothetical protein